MTVNEAQGHILTNVGIYLARPIFSHGQLRVALSCAQIASNAKLLLSKVMKKSLLPNKSYIDKYLQRHLVRKEGYLYTNIIFLLFVL